MEEECGKVKDFRVLGLRWKKLWESQGLRFGFQEHVEKKSFGLGKVEVIPLPY